MATAIVGLPPKSSQRVAIFPVHGRGKELPEDLLTAVRLRLVKLAPGRFLLMSGTSIPGTVRASGIDSGDFYQPIVTARRAMKELSIDVLVTGEQTSEPKIVWRLLAPAAQKALTTPSVD